MKKVVVNNSYDPCYLSNDALYMLFQMGFPLYEQPLSAAGRDESEFDIDGPDGFRALSGDYGALLKDDTVYSYGWDSRSPRGQLDRSHPALSKMVELLGPRATNGRFGRLSIEEIADDARYRITDYDNAEGVHIFSPDDYVDGQVYAEPPAPAVPTVGWFICQPEAPSA